MPELIDKQATLKKMCETCGYCERFEKAMRSTHPDFVADKCNAYKFLAEQPTTESEPVRHGRWIVRGQDIYCSRCNEESLYNPFGASKFSRFCPNCGARMDLRTQTETQLDEADSVMMGVLTMTLDEAIGYIQGLCDAVSDQPCGCDACPYGDTADDDGNCDVMRAINKGGGGDNDSE